jgi:hypothetical protein
MLGWHHEFECGFGILVQFLKKPRDAGEAGPSPERHKRWQHHDFEFSLRLAQRGFRALINCSCRTLFRSFFSQDQYRGPAAPARDPVLGHPKPSPSNHRGKVVPVADMWIRLSICRRYEFGHSDIRCLYGIHIEVLCAQATAYFQMGFRQFSSFNST